MSAVMFPMFLPDGTYVDKLIRVLIAITLFEAAYMAEVIRGGLQALPKGQYEAAKSLGYGILENAFFNNSSTGFKISYPRYCKYFLSISKRYSINLCCGTRTRWNGKSAPPKLIQNG